MPHSINILGRGHSQKRVNSGGREMQTLRINHKTEVTNGPGPQDTFALFEAQAALRGHSTHGLKFFTNLLYRISTKGDII